VVLYVTKPVAKIVGEFDLLELVTGTPEAVWNTTKASAGISKSFFLEYYAGRDSAVALSIGEVRRYGTPIEPSEMIEGFVPPQSFMYLDALDGSGRTGDLFTR
jgi:predicted transcriptional regulator